jgi:lipoprotein-releasing system permease protein
MNFALYIAKKSSLSHDGMKKSPAVKVAIISVALSVAVMLASICIVFGFKAQIMDKITGFNAHITIYKINESEPEDLEESLTILTPTLKSILDSEKYITNYEVELSVPAVLKTDSDFKGVYMRATNGKALKSFIGKNLVEGSYPSDTTENQIMISENTAKALNLKTGENIPTYFLNDNIKVRNLKVSGIYNTHFDLYDNLFGYCTIPTLENVVGISGGNKGTSIRILTDDSSRIEEYSQKLRKRLAAAYANEELFVTYQVENVYNQSASYISWLSLLDTNVAVILILMTLVACVTLISGMLILIIDKVSLIGILRSMGASSRQIRRLFIYMSLRIAIIGLVIGNILMLSFLYAEKVWHFIPLDAESYYINFVPVEFNTASIILLNAAITAIVFLSLLLPSAYASKISPTEAMRYKE